MNDLQLAPVGVVIPVLIAMLGAVAIVAVAIAVAYLIGRRRTTGFILELLSVEGMASGRFISYQTCEILAGTSHHAAELFVYALLYRMWRDGLVIGSVRHAAPRWGSSREAEPPPSLEVKDMDWKLTERGQHCLERHIARGRR